MPDGSSDTVLVVANLDPHSTRESTVRLDMGALGMEGWERFEVEDLVTGAVWEWGQDAFVRLGAEGEPVHVLAVRGR